MLNQFLLVACVCIVAALVFYLFYWNRFIAFILGLLIRLMWWNQAGSSMWIEIGSIHFSLLAGRILIKDFRYHSSNQTAKIVKIQIMWRYWIRRPTTEEELSHVRVGQENTKYSQRMDSCRLGISLQGLEWFLYNRTEAYDILAEFLESDLFEHPPRNQEPKDSSVLDDTAIYPQTLFPRFFGVPAVIKMGLVWLERRLPSLDVRDLMPVGLEASRVAIVCGNASTSELLVAEFRHGEGTYGFVPSRSKFDLYKMVLNVKFHNALIHYVENEDYKEPMPETGGKVHEHIKASESADLRSYLTFLSFDTLWRQLRIYGFIRPRHTHPKASGQRRSRRKSLDEDTPVGTDFSALEYAVERKILETPVLEVFYYADLNGEVPPKSNQIEALIHDTFDIGNGDLAPEWGVDLVIRSGFVRYGPWADRQRAELQRTFFPPVYADVVPHERLKPGDKRLWTSLNCFVQLRDDTTLYIPFREASKNWQWDGKVSVPRPRKRESSAIHITVGDSSTISYAVPMIATSNGYDARMDVHLDKVTVRSSLNDIQLLTSESCRIRGDLPSPLNWDDERTWTFAMSLRQPVFYLLRDHVHMLTDLAKDWSSGPPHDYQRFIPMVYVLELQMSHYNINMYANDQNIIDKPLIKEENALLTFHGDTLQNEIRIPLNVFRPESTAVSIILEFPDLYMTLSLPRWNTHALHAPNLGTRIGKFGLLHLHASYRYFTEVRDDNVEQLRMDFHARDVAVKALGWIVRYFLVLRNNYLGSFTHFSTLFEYLDKRKRGLPIGDPIVLKYRQGHANVFQTEVALNLENGVLLVPAGLPGYESHTLGQDPSDVGIGSCIVLQIPNLQVQFKLHDYFMEMSLNIDTISGCIEDDFSEQSFYTGPLGGASKETFMIDGVDVIAHRLFGPQPFTATYVCMWELHLGAVKTILSTYDAKVLSAAGNAFRLNFVDTVNAPAFEYAIPLDPDLTFLKLTVDTLNVTWSVGQAAVAVSLPAGLNIQSNDRPGKFHRKYSCIRMPQMSLKFLLRTGSERNPWLEAADLITDAYFDIYTSPEGWKDTAAAQAEFVQAQDVLTGRLKAMFETFDTGKPVDVFSFRYHLHKSGLFVPHPVLTRVHNHKVNTREGHQSAPQQSTSSDALPWSSRLSLLSESEGEEGVSEADRDARLAQSRFLVPVVSSHVCEDEGEMISGDESDNEDLIDGDSSESDWSYRKPDASGDISVTALAEYYYLTNHFSAPSLQTPSLWDGSPFTLTREVKIFGPFASDVHTPSNAHIGKPTLRRNFGKDFHTKVFRFESRKGLDARITPLLLRAASHLEAEMESKDLSLELGLDLFMVNYLDSFFASQQRRWNAMIVDASVASVRLRLIQRISVMEQDARMLSRILEDPPLDHQHVIAIVDVRSYDWHVTGQSMKPPTPTAREASATFSHSVSLGRTSITLDTVADKRLSHYSQSAAPRATVFGLVLLGSRGKFTPHSIQFLSDGISTELDHIGPEYLTATSMALVDAVHKLSQLQKKWSKHSTYFTKSVLYHVLVRSKDKYIVDPLSTIQPSYLVQSGLPYQLRTDPTFIFLFHLRNCLRYPGNNDQLLSASSEGAVPMIPEMDDVVSMLESRWLCLALDTDVSNIPNQSTMETLYSGLRIRAQDQSENSGPPLSLILVRIHRVSVSVRDPSTTSSSEFDISPLALALRMRSPEVIQSVPVYLQTLSEVSLREPPRQCIRHIVASISIGDISLTVVPYLMRFAQEVLRVRRHYMADPQPLADRPLVDGQVSSNELSDSILADITLTLQHLRVQAAAENLTFELGTSGAKIVSGIFFMSGGIKGLRDQSMNHAVIFDDIFLRARSPADALKRNDQDILASIVIGSGNISAVIRQELSSRMTIRAVSSIASIHFSVPRSALRLYRFVEEWRADFFPGIDATLQALLSELEKASARPLSPVSSRMAQRVPVIHVHGYLESFRVSLQVMHGTWLSWEVNKTVIYLRSINPRSPSQAFGLQLASQVFTISPKPSPTRDVVPGTQLKLELPTISLTGHFDDSSIHTLASVEFFHFKVKPSHWDTLLAVQQKFGQDFNDLLLLMGETRRKRNVPSTPMTSVSHVPLKYSGFLRMSGFRIGLESASSVAYLECEDIDGGIDADGGHTWYLRLSDLGLSLAPRAVPDSRQSALDKNRRSAFVAIDFQVSTGSRDARELDGHALHITSTKMHAVMQPSSIGEVGDFLDHLQADMLERKEQRSSELEAFKAKTKSVLETFEVNLQDEAFEDKSRWVSRYTINVTISNIGVAFPLTLDQDVRPPHSDNFNPTAVRAFLFSISSITFSAQRGETGHAIMKGFSFQFISQFKQSVPSDFSGENHQTRNRLLYPEMTAHVRSDHSSASRQIWITANVSGFILDLASSIPDYIFSLIDVYRHGEERVARLAAALPRSQAVAVSSPQLEAEPTTSQPKLLPTSNVLGLLTFLSGKVRMHSGAATVTSSSRILSSSRREPADDLFLESGADVFELPVVSVRAEYRGRSLSHSLDADLENEASILLFKSTIHSSENTLRPTLLPFLTEIVEHVEHRMRQVSARRSPTLDVPVVKPGPNPPAAPAVSSMQISFSLRIDQSKLELTCQPDVNVLAGMHWDSGGFVVNISPRAHQVTFTGSVDGLTVGLKHGFLSEDCVRLDARNLAFSVTLAKMDVELGQAISSLSAVLDTEFSGGVRFSRLQDVLCFKAVWLDRIPVFNVPPNPTSNKPSKVIAATPVGAPSPRQDVTTAFLLRIRQINLDIDLGQSISAVTLHLKNAIMRTKLTEAVDEVSLSVAEVVVMARGNVSGSVNVPRCFFQTIRRREGAGTAKMLELSMTSGALNAVLESDHQKLLQYRAEPLVVDVFDDWSKNSTQDASMEERPLRLSFIVSGSEVVAVATVGTIPKLLSYANKFKANLLAQREGASRESTAFRITQSPKPDNPLSAVANAMIHSARSKFKEAELGLSYMIQQHLSLEVGTLRLVVFPRLMADGELAQYVGSGVRARLDRLVQSDGVPGKRDLHLSFSSMTISKFTQLNQSVIGTTSPTDGKTWLNTLLRDASEAIIVGLPSMNMHMVTEEVFEELARVLVYDFHSRFVRLEGTKDMEDIYITLNVSLYSWLTVLRKNLSREMDQVQLAAEWQSTSAVVGPAITALRRKAPDISQIPDTTNKRDSTPQGSNVGDASLPSKRDTLPVHPTSPTSPAALPVRASTVMEQTRSGSAIPEITFPKDDGLGAPAVAKSNSGPPAFASDNTSVGVIYRPRRRHIERLTMRQLGEATPDVMHPFFMKKAGFNLEDSLPQYVNEFAAVPLEKIMEVLLQLYSKQLPSVKDVEI